MQPAIRILYEDDCLVVFDKPSGLLVIPAPQEKSHTLTDIVNRQCAVASQTKLYPCHRLDRETSGVIIYARGKANQQLMMNEFHKGTVKKTYLAFVLGKMKNPAGEIKSVIRDFHQDRFESHGRRGKSPGKLAITRYKVVAVKRQFSVVEVFPVTGRTNQIRIHFSELGHPLLGERLYALGRDFPVKFRRVALHSGEVTFPHPVLKKNITVTSELAKDMENFWNRY